MLRLVCLDFDGTIMAYDGEREYLHPAAVAMLNELERRGVAWCSNSGRHVESQLRVLETTCGMGLVHMPIALLCSESLLFLKRNGGYVSCEPWNTMARSCLCRLHQKAQEIVACQLPVWMNRYRLRPHLSSEYTVFDLDPDKDQPALFHAELADAIKALPDSIVVRNGTWVSVLPAQLGKGNVLQGFLGKSRLPAHGTLSIGDHLNDLSMLDGSVCGLVACPGNAAPEVAAAVRTAGGYVAQAAGPEGTVEAIRFFLGEAGPDPS